MHDARYTVEEDGRTIEPGTDRATAITIARSRAFRNRSRTRVMEFAGNRPPRACRVAVMVRRGALPPRYALPHKPRRFTKLRLTRLHGKVPQEPGSPEPNTAANEPASPDDPRGLLSGVVRPADGRCEAGGRWGPRGSWRSTKSA